MGMVISLAHKIETSAITNISLLTKIGITIDGIFLLLETSHTELKYMQKALTFTLATITASSNQNRSDTIDCLLNLEIYNHLDLMYINHSDFSKSHPFNLYLFVK